MSAGIRSDVNWMRRRRSASASPNALTIVVLPRPGTPSSRAWPPHRTATRTPRIAARWPTMTSATDRSTASATRTSVSGSSASRALTAVVAISAPEGAGRRAPGEARPRRERAEPGRRDPVRGRPDEVAVAVPGRLRELLGGEGGVVQRDLVHLEARRVRRARPQAGDPRVELLP